MESADYIAVQLFQRWIYKLSATAPYYINPQERKPQAQRDWQDLLQGRAHNVHEVDVCALSLL